MQLQTHHTKTDVAGHTQSPVPTPFRRTYAVYYFCAALAIIATNAILLLSLLRIDPFIVFGKAFGALLIFGYPTVAIACVALVSIRLRVYSTFGGSIAAATAVLCGVFNGWFIAAAKYSV
jgi:hypothetical protein